MLHRRRTARTSIGQIIPIQSIEHGLDLLLLRERFYSGIHFLLAKVATVRSVREIVLVLCFEGTQHHMARADLLRDFLGFIQFSARQRRA